MLNLWPCITIEFDHCGAAEVSNEKEGQLGYLYHQWISENSRKLWCLATGNGLTNRLLVFALSGVFKSRI